MENLLQFLAEHWGTLLGLTYALVNVAGFVADLTPSEKDNKIVAKIKSFLDRLSLIGPKGFKLPGQSSESK